MKTMEDFLFYFFSKRHKRVIQLDTNKVTNKKIFALNQKQMFRNKSPAESQMLLCISQTNYL